MLLFIIKQNEPLFCLPRILSGVISVPQEFQFYTLSYDDQNRSMLSHVVFI